MPNYKGVEVSHVILTEDDVVLHAAAQGSADAVIYADAEVEPPSADEPSVGEDGTESQEVHEGEEDSSESTQPEVRKTRRRRRDS